MMYQLGLKPPRPGSIQMKFGSYFSVAELPKPPLVIGRPWLIRQWGMLGNDVSGDCFWAGACHETMMLYADAAASVPMFTSRTALKDYHNATGPHDEGTDLQDGCAYRQKTGILDALGNRHTIDVYTGLRPGDLDEIDLAVHLFGIAGIGVELPDNAESQFNYGEAWSIEENRNGTIGGHYIPCIGRNSHGYYLVVTWGRLQAVEPEWITEYMDQGVAIVSRERLGRSGLSPQGYDLAKLEDDFKQLTGA